MQTLVRVDGEISEREGSAHVGLQLVTLPCMHVLKPLI
jgi:hypothetical protein